MEDIEFSYIGEEETLDDNLDLNEDYEVRTVRVNSEGKKIRGKDMSWVKKINFNNPKAYEDSNVLEELTLISCPQDKNVLGSIFFSMHYSFQNILSILRYTYF